jgi:hypothetical protein
VTASNELTRRPTRHWVVVAVVGLLLLVAIGLAVSSLGRARETAHRAKCRKIMRAIGQACLLYSNENRGRLPQSLGQLVVTQDVTTEVFVCPSSDDTPARGHSLEERAVNLAKPGHASYVAALHPADERVPFVLFYEPMSNHGDGFHAVYSDGHVEFFTGAGAEDVQLALRSGVNPPPTFP